MKLGKVLFLGIAGLLVLSLVIPQSVLGKTASPMVYCQTYITKSDYFTIQETGSSCFDRFRMDYWARECTPGGITTWTSTTLIQHWCNI